MTTDDWRDDWAETLAWIAVASTLDADTADEAYDLWLRSDAWPFAFHAPDTPARMLSALDLAGTLRRPTAADIEHGRRWHPAPVERP